MSLQLTLTLKMCRHLRWILSTLRLCVPTILLMRG
nr:MAG TPA: hypothetical protein [Caudoviricetes sp.]